MTSRFSKVKWDLSTASTISSSSTSICMDDPWSPCWSEGGNTTSSKALRMRTFLERLVRPCLAKSWTWAAERASDDPDSPVSSDCLVVTPCDKSATAPIPESDFREANWRDKEDVIFKPAHQPRRQFHVDQSSIAVVLLVETSGSKLVPARFTSLPSLRRCHSRGIVCFLILRNGNDSNVTQPFKYIRFGFVLVHLVI